LDAGFETGEIAFRFRKHPVCQIWMLVLKPRACSGALYVGGIWGLDLYA
jgi:hypothetical protein